MPNRICSIEKSPDTVTVIIEVEGPQGPAKEITETSLLSVIDTLPTLPVDPSTYPDAGGLFKDGDANGYRLVRILPKV